MGQSVAARPGGAVNPGTWRRVYGPARMTVYGVHAGLQNTTDRGPPRPSGGASRTWASTGSRSGTTSTRPPSGDGADSLEAVATHAALACDTERVRCGSLVYSVGYRHPAVLANAICTIDQLSGGRADLGLGAGWSQIEYDAYGIPFPPVKVRMDQLEEAIQCVRGLLRDEVTDFEGQWFQLHEARCEPRPVQAELPIWIGGSGERRTLRIAAQWADGWNVPFVAPDTFAHKRDVLHAHCADVGRDPAEIRVAVNLGLAWTRTASGSSSAGWPTSCAPAC